MIYKITNYKKAILFEQWAKDNDVYYEELDEGNYVDKCPECGDDEFWHNGCCGHCGCNIHM